MEKLIEVLESLRLQGTVVLGVSLNSALFQEFIESCEDNVDTRNAIPVRVHQGKHEDPIIITHVINR